MSLPHDIRHYDVLGDESFIYSTWLKSYHVPRCPQPIYNIGQRHLINAILADKNTSVKVACDSDNPELIFGYIVSGSGNSLHYLYVKGMYRGQGIGRSLLDSLQVGPILYTHRPPAEWIMGRLQTEPRFIYNPYLLQQ